MTKSTWVYGALLVVVIILGVFIWRSPLSPFRTSFNDNSSINLAAINASKHHKNPPPPSFPDLVVSSLSWSPASSITGDHIVFSAIVKNQGTGATPAGTIIGISFWVDGVNVTWSDTDTASLAPGASVTLTANSGPSGVNYWTATAGAHTILGNVDDVNRIVESDKSNNTLTASMNVAPVPVGDTIPPSVAITSPTNGTSFSVGTSIPVSIFVSDNIGITRTEFYVDNILLATSNASPWAFTWNTTGASAITHIIMVKAYDAAGNIGISGNVLVTLISVPPPIQNPLSKRFGLSIGANMYSMNDTVLNNQLNDMVSLGVGWVRFDVQWNLVQAQDSTSFNWTPTDRVIQAVLAHHLQPLPILTYSPPWAQSVGCTYGFLCGTNKSAEFGVFAKAAATRYGPQGVHAWEIWNEPNIKQFWEPQPDVVAYSALLKAAYFGIKSQDPSAIVVSAGLAPAATMVGSVNPMDFITQMYGLGDKGSFDALGIHPYTFPLLPSTPDTWSAWAQMASTTPNIRSIMASNGDSAKQIWMTEFGAPTGGPDVTDHVDEAMQNQMMIDAINGVKGFPSDGPLFWYSYKDSGTDPSTNENFFGIIRFDGSLKPAYGTLKATLAP